MIPSILDTIRSYARAVPGEVCGALVITLPNHAEFIPCANLSKFPDVCHFCPKDLAGAEDKGHLVGYVHTHDAGAVPSQTDIDFCRRSRKPWWIVSPDSWTRINSNLPLERRPFAWGVQDCYTLISDWFSEEGVVLPEFTREPDFWKHGKNPYMDGIKVSDFEIVKGQPERGDIILMAIQSRDDIPNHAAVHVGNGEIIHHLPKRLSMVELYDGIYQDATRAVVRRKRENN